MCNCEAATNTLVGACDVCGWVNNDWSHKPVQYCPTCDAWICGPHWNDWPARMQAAAKKHLAMIFIFGRDRGKNGKRSKK